MGVQALEQVRSTAPFWTSFPALAISSADWDDHEEAHRAVMRLFPHDLAGPVGQRRAASGILFRHDLLSGVPTVLVQSLIPPELLPTQARSMTVPVKAWSIREGTQVEFRVAVNPVSRFRGCTRVVGDDELPRWLRARIGSSLTDMTLLNSVTRVTHSTRGQQMLTIKTIDAVGRVLDADKFAALRLHGVGRSKSYGAGLLTARPLG